MPPGEKVPWAANFRAAVSPCRVPGRPLLEASSRSALTMTRVVDGQGSNASMPVAVMQAAIMVLSSTMSVSNASAAAAAV